MFKWFKNLFKSKPLFCKDCKWCLPGKIGIPGEDTDCHPDSKWTNARCLSPLNYDKLPKLKKHKLYLVGDGDLAPLIRTRLYMYCFSHRDGCWGCSKYGLWFEPKDKIE